MISLGQLQACSLSKDRIGRATAAGHLHALGGGVYCLAAAPPTPRGRCWAALLRGRPESAISHRTAAVLWALLKDWGALVHLTARSHRRHRAGLAMHQAALAPQDVVQRHGLRVTSLARTLLDLAATESHAVLLVAVRQALTLHRTRKRSIFAILERAGGHRGRGPLRRALAAIATDPGAGDTRGALEDAFWLALVPHVDRLPPYERNVQIRLPSGEVYLADIVFPGPRVVLELDARDHHDNDPSFDSDRRRDQRLAATGRIVMRITPRHLKDEVEAVIDDLLTTLEARS